MGNEQFSGQWYILMNKCTYERFLSFILCVYVIIQLFFFDYSGGPNKKKSVESTDLIKSDRNVKL